MSNKNSRKFERAWCLVNILVFIAYFIFALSLEASERAASVAGASAAYLSVLVFSFVGLFFYSGRIPQRYKSGYISRDEYPFLYWFLLTVLLLVGFSLLLRF